MNKKCFLYIGMLVSVLCGTNLFSIPKLDMYHLAVICYYGNFDISDLKSLTFVSKHVKEGIAILHINPKALDSAIVENPKMLTNYLKWFNIIIPNLRTISLDSRDSFSENFVRQVRQNLRDGVILDVPEWREGHAFFVDDKQVKFSPNRAFVDISPSIASGIVCCFSEFSPILAVKDDDASIVEELLRPKGYWMSHFEPKTPEGKILSTKEVLTKWPGLNKFNVLEDFEENLLDKINQEIDLRNRRLECELWFRFELNRLCFTYCLDVNTNKEVCIFDISPVQRDRALEGKKPFARVGRCLVKRVSNLELKSVKCLHGNNVFNNCSVERIDCPDLVLIVKDVFRGVRGLKEVIMPQLTKIVEVGDTRGMYRWYFCIIVGTAEGFDTVISKLNGCSKVIHKDFGTNEIVEEYNSDKDLYTSGNVKIKKSLFEMKDFCRRREQARQQELVDTLRLADLEKMLENWK